MKCEGRDTKRGMVRGRGEEEERKGGGEDGDRRCELICVKTLIVAS